MAVCYLCLDGGLLEPLQRDCACRGTDAGFVHLSCLTNYAETKSKGWDGRDIYEFREPWDTCPSCHQEYQNELAVDIATEFVSFVRRNYPDDTQKQVESLDVKLCAFNSMLIRLTAEQKREVGVTANVLLSLIDRMRVAAPLPERYSIFEAEAYHTHGRIAFDEGTEDCARRAVVHFENALEVLEAIGDDDGIATAKCNIAVAKSKYEDGSNNEELMKTHHELYELRIAEHGRENDYTIDAGIDYAVYLRKASLGEDARELLTKLLVTSKQVLGPHHNTTKKVESELTKIVEVASQD
jgi:hypothetical protein